MATSFVLKTLTMDQIQQAFEKTRAEVNIPGIRLELITEENYDKALEFAHEHYVLKEPVKMALGTEWTDELKQFWIGSFKFNLSLMFVDEKTVDMIAMRTIRIACRDDSNDNASVQSETLKDLFEYVIHCDKKADFFGHYGITEAFHFLGLAVHDKYKRRGYATQIFRAAISMIRHFGFDTVYVKGEGSSNFSKKIYEKTDFELLYEKCFDSWVVDGKRKIQNTGEHKSMKVYGLKVTQND